MRWTTKARIQRACARLPKGPDLYLQVQRRFGTLSSDPTDRLDYHRAMVSWLAESGRAVEGASCVEVGTGYKPTIPVLFALCGAASVTTIDLYPKLQWDLVEGSLGWFEQHRDLLVDHYEGVVEASVIDERLAVLAAHRGDPAGTLDALGIHVLAPADAAATELETGSVDVHFSATTLEHIDPPTLRAIVGEAHRLLRPDGAFLHFVDPGDHFADGTDEITDVNFLRYSSEEWTRLAGNQFGYCNRLRASDHLHLIERGGFEIERTECTVPPESRAALEAGFPVHPAFAGYDFDDLCAVDLRILARPA